MGVLSFALELAICQIGKSGRHHRGTNLLALRGALRHLYAPLKS
jgi:hypothetical protein